MVSEKANAAGVNFTASVISFANPTPTSDADNAKGRPTPWHPHLAEDSLAIMKEKDGKDAEAAFERKKMQTIMRRMKSRGKSDARVREMVCYHLPKGTGPLERQGVSTFSENEVKQSRAKFQEAVMEPQRAILKNLFELRETR